MKAYGDVKLSPKVALVLYYALNSAGDIRTPSKGITYKSSWLVPVCSNKKERINVKLQKSPVKKAAKLLTMTCKRIWIQHETGFALQAFFGANQIKNAFLTICDGASDARSRLLVYSLVIIAAEIKETSGFRT